MIDAPSAIGHVVEEQSDANDPSSDFHLEGDVDRQGPLAQIGITITHGTGAAADHVGETFYLFAFAGDAKSRDTEIFGDGGFTGFHVPPGRCPARPLGLPDAVVTKGQIAIQQ